MTTQTMTAIERGVSERTRGVVTPLNLHIAGVGLLALVNLYLLVHMGLAWEAKRSRNAEALAQQTVVLRTAEIAARPFEGLDAKLARATEQADKFYETRLPGSDSEVAAELGALAKEAGAKLTRVQYIHAPDLAGTPGELTEVKMDASLNGGYRAMALLINSLERDKKFFVIEGLTLTGQQSGAVNLRLRLASYERGRIVDAAEGDAAPAAGPAAADAGADGGPKR